VEWISGLLETHCSSSFRIALVAHREDLALTASWKDNNLLKNVEVLLRTVYTLFSQSSVKTAALAELASVNEVDFLSFRPIQEVRWPLRHFAASAFVRNEDALVVFCEEQINECSDPICTYVLRCIQDPQYLLALYTLNDVLNELANSLKVLQKSALSPIETHQLCVSEVRKLEAQYLGDNTFWNDKAGFFLRRFRDPIRVPRISNRVPRIREYHRTSKIRENRVPRIREIRSLQIHTGYLTFSLKTLDKAKQILTENEDIDTRQITPFIRSVCDHLYARYPPDELECWSAFDPTALKNCTYDFGVAEVKKLRMQYKDLINVTNDNLIIKQYNDSKFLMSEKLISGAITSLPEIAAITINDEQFNLFSMLVDICCTFQASRRTRL